ncbi:hypothetical protein Haur_1381 [Herpetosiphon aurantiacus DSM 785]|uniref:Uncharacterized protein n=1 Tax=Herpetosiphon aurantiacus (strain ATCC 23779 / DSM 785 / 114-95) TaxID=316274 RepID=A9B2I1_HERA2|nr:hypothetical protein Haur_1381 [Herpetosiphon aurantiacus DSM 785]
MAATSETLDDCDSGQLPPAWVEAYAQQVRDCFSLQGWDIYVRPMTKEQHDEEPTTAGLAHVNHRYSNAVIEYWDQQPVEPLKRVLVHEFLHILVAPLTTLIEAMLLEIPVKRRGMFMHEMQIHAEEQVVTALTRIIFPLLQQSLAAHAIEE